jgi:hypothetical protein
MKSSFVGLGTSMHEALGLIPAPKKKRTTKKEKVVLWFVSWRM